MSVNVNMEKVWLDKHKYDEAERRFYEGKSNVSNPQKLSKDSKAGKKGKHETIEESKFEDSKRERKGDSQNSIVSEIVRCREHILLSLNGLEAGSNNELICNRMEKLENDNKNLKILVSELQSAVSKLETRIVSLESQKTTTKSNESVQNGAARTVEKAKDDDDDLDLFASDEDENANELREQRLKAYAEKKAKKPEVIAKSSVILEVKPWDDETDMALMEKNVRSIIMDGLVWGVSKLVPVAFNVKKLQIVCVVEDDKVSVEELTEKIEEFEDVVQSVDIAAFQKI